MTRQDGKTMRARQGERPETIPDKLCFRIGEVARICAVPSYVLRFWEREFPQLRPGKGGTGQRMYRRRDVEMALRVRRLLYDEGYTIPGARQWLREGGRAAGAVAGSEDALPDGPAGDAGFAVAAGAGALLAMRAELEEIVRMLAGSAGTWEARRTVEAKQRVHRSGRRGDAVVSETGSMPLFAALHGTDEGER